MRAGMNAFISKRSTQQRWPRCWSGGYPAVTHQPADIVFASEEERGIAWCGYAGCGRTRGRLLPLKSDLCLHDVAARIRVPR